MRSRDQGGEKQRAERYEAGSREVRSREQRGKEHGQGAGSREARSMVKEQVACTWHLLHTLLD